MLIVALAELTARTYSVGSVCPFPGDKPSSERDVAEWAGRAFRFLSEQTSKLGLDPVGHPRGRLVHESDDVRIAAEQRLIGDYDAGPAHRPSVRRPGGGVCPVLSGSRRAVPPGLRGETPTCEERVEGW